MEHLKLGTVWKHLFLLLFFSQILLGLILVSEEC